MHFEMMAEGCKSHVTLNIVEDMGQSKGKKTIADRKLDYTGDGVNKQINGDPTSGMKTMAARLLSDNIIVLNFEHN